MVDLCVDQSVTLFRVFLLKRCVQFLIFRMPSQVPWVLFGAVKTRTLPPLLPRLFATVELI
jgi:hypothetical protein